MDSAKPFCISKREVFEAYKQVRKNRGSAGVDGQTMADFEANLKDNLYRIWNRLSSGSYMPPPVLRVEIPKGDGTLRPLGIPSISDRIAQMVVKRYLEPVLEPIFHRDSYGYRPNRSAHDALAVARRRCWEKGWVVDLDVKGFFDNLDWELLMKALRKHTECKWVLMYVERWLKAPVAMPDGSLVYPTKGTPQGGVVSPLLSNLFLHYCFDVWMARNYPSVGFERYADDAICHCASENEAKRLREALEQRFVDCKLELHPEKTKIVYCKDSNRGREYPVTAFDFLGYTFRPRTAANRRGELFVSFSPAVSHKASKSIRSTIRGWRLHHWNSLSLNEVAGRVRAKINGWINYYGRFNRTILIRTLRTLNYFIARWVRRKYKNLKAHRSRAWEWLSRLRSRQPNLFPHWQLGEKVGR
jgi:group II intron reverse transcriptase/maturase